VKLEDYSMNSVTEGIEALASTRVVISPVAGGPNDNNPFISKERKFSGSGSDTDIVTASARAYTSAINKLLKWTMRRQSEDEDGDDGTAVLAGSPKPTAVEAN
jgi:2-isopropylmalate synthase